MTGNVLVGVDAGTSVIKAVAFDPEGRQLAVASRRNAYATLSDGGAEQDMSRTWLDTVSVLRDLSQRVEGLPKRVLAMAVTGQGDGCWLIDADGQPVHDAWLWLDARAAAEARQLSASDVIDTVYRRTGTGVNGCQMRTQLLWMQRNDPELLERAATAMHCKDWLYFNLTGQRATDPTEGVFTFGDYRTRTYSDEVIEALGLSGMRRLFPPIVDGAVESHRLCAAAAAAIGLPVGLPVSLGYVDIMCTAMGAGLHDRVTCPGLTVLGSTGMHMRFVPGVDDVSLNVDRSGYTMGFPGMSYAQMQTNMAATINIDWILGLASEILAAEGVERHSASLLEGLDERVMNARPGAAVYHPYILGAGERGPFMEPNARAGFNGLDQSVGWFDMVRAVYDSLAFAARDCYVAMGTMPAEIRLTGGAARSRALARILAAVLNAPIRPVVREETGAAGAAMIAAVAQGIHPDIEAASKVWAKPYLGSAERPDQNLVTVYDSVYSVYRTIRTTATPVWNALAEMRGALT